MPAELMYSAPLGRVHALHDRCVVSTRAEEVAADRVHGVPLVIAEISGMAAGSGRIQRAAAGVDVKPPNSTGSSVPPRLSC